MLCEPGCATCGHLRRAALDIVGSEGGAALSVGGLAEVTGLTSEQVTAHYSTTSACLSATYDEVASGLLSELVQAFTDGPDWLTAFERARHRLLGRMTAHPAEARLCFVETVRGDRALRLRRELTRRRVVAFLDQERRAELRDVPLIQLEMLLGAGFQIISTGVAIGQTDLTALEPRLAQVQGFFLPAPVIPELGEHPDTGGERHQARQQVGEHPLVSGA
jgi:AcrR family transcriptional regulator